MQLPFFYIAEYTGSQQLVLNEDTSRHVVQVLRMMTGERLNLTDGKGHLLQCEITETGKKHCAVRVVETINQKPKTKNITIAISLLKNANRFEWFLEKATEIGVSEIIPLICDRTEKEKFRHDRLNAICISAMLQSQQCWLPLLHEPTLFDKCVTGSYNGLKLIAHCDEGDRKTIPQFTDSQLTNSLILIGPEGDFSQEEIQLGLQHEFIPVLLGGTRLRTETAGMVAATLLTIR